MSVSLKELRGLEDILSKRLDRIEAGMDLIMQTILVSIPLGAGKLFENRWEEWKSERRNYNL
jgi:hypothetical protein